MRKIPFQNKPNGVRCVGIVIKDNKILIMKRNSYGKKYFVLPGGHLEENETTEQAVIREIKEETSLNVSINRLLYHHDIVDDSDHYFYKCEYIDGEIKLNGPELKKHLQGEDLYEPMWYPICDIKKIKLYPLEIRDLIIEDYKNNFLHEVRELKCRIDEVED